MKRSLALILSLLSWVHTAAAQSPADRETARALLDEGDRAFAARRYADALSTYLQADRIMNVPTTGVEVSKAYQALGQLVEAKEACRKVLAHPRTASEPAPFTEARNECTTRTQSLTERIPSVTLRIQGVPEGTTPHVTIDGADVLVTAFEMKRRLNPGAHRVVVTAAGYNEVSRPFSVAESATANVDITLTPTGRAPTASPAERAPTPTPTPASASAAPRAPSRERAPIPLYAGVLVGVGAVGIGAGAVSGVLALSHASDAKKLCQSTSCDPAAGSDIDAAKTWSHVSTVAFAVGVVGAGVGLIGIMSRGEVDAPAKVDAYFTGTGGGIAGRF